MDVKTTIEKGLNICETEGCNNTTTATEDYRFYAFCDECRIKKWAELMKNSSNNEFRAFCRRQIEIIKKKKEE